MKSVRIAQDFVPIAEFKTHASRLLRDLTTSGRPLVVTQNGKPTAVVITPDEFDRLRERYNFVKSVEEGLADSEAGRLIDDAELGREITEQFGAAGG